MKFTNMKLLRPCFVAVAVIMLCAGTASAAPVYSNNSVEMYLKQNTFPSGLDEYKVYLDAAQLPTVIGHVGSQTGSVLVNFSSNTDTLDAANGFSTIKSATDNYINNITITAPGYWFGDLIFSVNLAPNANNDLTIIATPKFGAAVTYAGWTSESAWVNEKTGYWCWRSRDN